MTAVSVKVPRERLIDALQKSLDAENLKTGIEEIRALQKVNNDAYNADLVKWGKAVAKVLAREGSKYVSRSYNNQITFDASGIDLPEPPKEKSIDSTTRQDTSKIRNLENAITILKLSEEPFVNASTYKSVVQYL